MSWNSRAQERKGIRKICRRRILNDVFRKVKKEKEWNVLVLGPTGMNIISACFKTDEILSENIALIERLGSRRFSLPYLSTIYMLIPSDQNIDLLLQDFAEFQFRKVHLFFLSAVPDEKFKRIALSIDPFKVFTCVEMDMLFLPKESQVFSLQDKSFFTRYYDTSHDVNLPQLEIVAKKLVNVFSTLGVVPLIRYRRNFVKNYIFAEILEKELEAVKKSIWKTTPKAINRCQLLILDRGFDCVSPLLHEFTFQAMAYDLLDIKNDIYEYTLTQGHEVGTTQSVPLNEDSAVWCQLRHGHIANIAKDIQNKIETDTLMEKTSFIRKKGIENLSDTIKHFILSKQTETVYSYRHMANECMKRYVDGINLSTPLEQNLAMGTTAEGKRVTNPLGSVRSVISEPKLELDVKLRLLLLYIFFAKGISKQAFDDIVKAAQIPSSAASDISNLLHLKVDLFHPGRCIAVHDSGIKRKRSDSVYKQSRWTPLLRDILLSCVKGKLSEDQYPFLRKYHQNEGLVPRKDYWCTDKVEENAYKLIVFIIGGPVYSELRCVYEVMEMYPGWNIFIGGETILTPKKFLKKLSHLQPLNAKVVKKNTKTKDL